MARKPYLFIMSGPMGSGKTSLHQKVTSYLNLKEHKTVKVILDEHIETNPAYKRFILNVTKKECKGKKKLCKTLKNKVMKPDKSLMRKLEKGYFKSREKQHCKTGKLLKSKENKDNIWGYKIKSCSWYNNKSFQDGVKNGHDIIFETNGNYFPSWIFEPENGFFKHIQKHKYKVVMAWSFTSLKELMKRNKGRAIKALDSFLKDSTNNAPRFPDTTLKVYKPLLVNIQKVFYDVIQKCVHTYDKVFCKYPIQFVVVDNTEKQFTDKHVIYDSHDKSRMNEGKIRKLLALNTKSRKKTKIMKTINKTRKR